MKKGCVAAQPPHPLEKGTHEQRKDSTLCKKNQEHTDCG